MKHPDWSVLGLQLDPFACGHFRLKYPLQTLKSAGVCNTHTVMAGRTGFTLEHIDLSGYTHVIAQRQFEGHTLNALLAARQRWGTTLLYEVDDNLHHVHPESHAYRVFRPGGVALKAHDTWVRNVDGLIVTTPELAGQYSRLTNRVYVVPNYLDLNIRDWRTPPPRDPRLEGKLVIGWAGGSTHAEDDEPLRGVLDLVLRDYPDVVFALCSHPQMMELFRSRQGLPKDRVVMLDPVDFVDYPRIPAQFDIGIAPLRDTLFNRNKSALKIMEYGAWGVPYVASDIAPYRRFHQETKGVGGFLAATKTEWDTALRFLIESDTGRGLTAQFGQKEIWDNWGLQENVGKWEEVLTQSLNRNAVSVWESTEKPGRNDACPCGSGVKYKRCCAPAFG
jgi:hypothetical protein